jgi:hypothetical protein
VFRCVGKAGTGRLWSPEGGDPRRVRVRLVRPSGRVSRMRPQRPRPLKTTRPSGEPTEAPGRQRHRCPGRRSVACTQQYRPRTRRDHPCPGRCEPVPRSGATAGRTTAATDPKKMIANVRAWYCGLARAGPHRAAQNAVCGRSGAGVGRPPDLPGDQTAAWRHQGPLNAGSRAPTGPPTSGRRPCRARRPARRGRG